MVSELNISVIVTRGLVVLISLDFRTSLYPLHGGSLATCWLFFGCLLFPLCCGACPGYTIHSSHGRMLLLVLVLVTVVYIIFVILDMYPIPQVILFLLWAQ